MIGMRWNYKTPEEKALHKKRQEDWRIRCEELMKKHAEEQRIKEEQIEKERLALLMLLSANGNEEAINKACDIIKSESLVDGYR